MTARPGAAGHLARTLVAVLALALGSSLPGPVAAGDPSATDPGAGGRAQAAEAQAHATDVRSRQLGPGDEPSQAYLDSVAAEGRRFTFEPGGRVTVGFRPRADDRWPVGGEAPRPLPAGRRSGADIARGADTGAQDPPGDAAPPSSTPPVPASPPVDAPVSPAPPAEAPPAEEVPPTAEPSPSPDLPPPDADAGQDGAAIPATVATATAPAAGAEIVPAAAGMRREVYGFLPYWEVSDSSTRVDFRIVTHMAYFSVGADSKGNLRKRNSDGSLTTGWAGWTSSKMTSLINEAHKQGSRVTLTLTVFAWTANQASIQKALLGSSTARLNLARQAVAAVRDRGADGINLDFEPLVSGYEDEFVALVRTMRAELDKVAKGYHLSFDTLGYPGNYPLEKALASGGADAVFVMGYDYRTAGSNYAGSIDPLAGPAYDLTETVRAYTARVPASRVILGVPYYGRAWSTVSDKLNARTQTGTKYGSSTAVNYENAVPLAAEHGRRYDATEVSAWTAYRKQNCTSTYGCVTTWRQLYYDDAATLKARYDLVNRAGLRGTGMWALGYDGTRTELYRALADKFLNDTTAPLAGIRAFSTAPRRDEGFTVSWTATDDWSGIAGYDVQVSSGGGAWTAWLTNTKATSATFLGTDNSGYAFRVRARDGKGNVSAWNVTSVYAASPALARGGFLRVTAETVNVRAAPTTGATRVATAVSGDVFAITGGPATADGYTWYQVTGPLDTWGPVGDVYTSAWVAASSSSATNAVATRAPNAALVGAMIRLVGFSGAGAASLGTGAAAVAARSFSPNGDGSEDRLPIRWNNRFALDDLELRVLRPDGTSVGAIPLAATAAGWQTTDWDGRAGGGPLADGSYILQLVGSIAGTTYHWPAAAPARNGIPARIGVVIDRVPPTIASAAISATKLSPNGDGKHDSVKVTGSGSTDVARWEVLVAPLDGPAAGTVVRRLAGTGRSAAATWAGTADDGARVPDGRYRVTLRFLDPAGNPVTRSWTVVVDTTPPALAVTTSPAGFSPDGDGVADTTRIRWSSAEPVTGTLRILRDATVVRSWTITGTSGGLTWNGKDAAGRIVADGRLTVRVSAADALGNRGSRSTALVVDRTAGWLRWSPTSFFAQDGDGLAATSAVSVRLKRTARVTLRILDASGAEVRRPWSDRELTAGTRSWRWDGRTSSGGWAPQGRYVAELTATSWLGTTVLRRAVVAAGFTATLAPASPVAGSRLTVTFRSVEPLASAPTASLLVPGRATLPMSVARLADGSWRATVVVPADAAGPARVSLRGRDTAGGRNRTDVAVTIR
jgi:spore germination protein YaaH/flagellar hook assembly protein FlgD